MLGGKIVHLLARFLHTLRGLRTNWALNDGPHYFRQIFGVFGSVSALGGEERTAKEQFGTELFARSKHFPKPQHHIEPVARAPDRHHAAVEIGFESAFGEPCSDRKSVQSSGNPPEAPRWTWASIDPRKNGFTRSVNLLGAYNDFASGEVNRGWSLIDLSAPDQDCSRFDDFAVTDERCARFGSASYGNAPGRGPKSALLTRSCPGSRAS